MGQRTTCSACSQLNSFGNEVATRYTDELINNGYVDSDLRARLLQTVTRCRTLREICFSVATTSSISLLAADVNAILRGENKPSWTCPNKVLVQSIQQSIINKDLASLGGYYEE